MSGFGGTVSGFNSDRIANTKPGSDYSDDRRNGRRKQFNNNNRLKLTTNKTNTNQENGSSKNKVWRKQEKLLPEPEVQIQDIPTQVIPSTTTKYLNFSEDQIKLTGGILENPQLLGFKPGKKIHPRPIPKYLLLQPRLLTTPPFIQNDWDKQNQSKMESMEQANHNKDFQGLYEEFQKMREVERKQMESLGLVDAENISKDLNDAISFQGSCLAMCPVFERVRRQLENNVKALEKDPVTNVISRDFAVKAFSRPAAGQPPPLPSEVRPPHVLKHTLDYLVDNIVEKLPEAHSFIWDRTRSIRQDFTYQNSFGPEAIDCNERIVRIHLLSLHIMAGSDVEYSQQQELEQFNKSLQTLIEIYQDVRNHGGKAPNEAEFRSYHLISHYRDPELEREIQTLPNHIYNDPQVQMALKIRNLMSQNNIQERGHINSVGALNLFVEFFRVVYSEKTPFLLSCLLETHFNEIRFYALKAMARSYHTKGGAYPANSLAEMLGYSSVDELVKFVKYYDIDVVHENSNVFIDLFNKEKLENKYKLKSVQAKPKLAQPYSSQLDNKIRGKSLKSFINQGFSNKNLGIKSYQNIVDAAPITKKPIEIKNKTSVPFGTPPVAGNSNTPIVQIETKPQVFSFAPPQTKLVPNTLTFNTFPAKPSNSMPSQPQGIFSKPIPNEPNKTSTVTSSKFEFKLPEVKFASPASKPEVESLSKSTQNVVSLNLPISKSNEKANTVSPSLSLSNPKEDNKNLDLVPAKSKLSSSPQYQKALNELVSQMISEVVDNELGKLLPKLIQRSSSRREREEIISSLSNELYQAFISEVIYNSCLQIQADFIYQRNLKLHSIKGLVKTAKIAKQKNELKQMKVNELKEITFKNHGLKRFASNLDISFSRKRHEKSANSTIDIIARQDDMQELWSPLDLQSFVANCSKNIKIGGELPELQLIFLIVVENWQTSYSKWLNNKLQLKVNTGKLNYENEITNDKIVMNFTSLPSKAYLNQEFFSKTCFVLFECGLVQETNQTIDQKLTKDEAALNKMISLIEKFSYYHVQIIILVWDVSESGVTSQKIEQLLQVDKHKQLVDIVVCNMASSDNINQELIDGFNQLSDNFHGELSNKGKKKRQNKPKFIIPPGKEVSNFQQKEKALLDKAKKLRKYDYLTQHVMNNKNSSSNQFIPSSKNESYNSSFINNLTMQRRRNDNNNNSSTFINSTTGFNTTINNVSILTGFGNGVLEKSTPMTSPKPRKQPSSETLPKTLQELRNLTTSITSKYNRTNLSSSHLHK